MYFRKIGHSFKVPDFDVGDLAVQYGIDGPDGSFNGIRYDHLKEENQCPLKNIIPDEFRHKFTMQFMQVNSYIPPHTDSGTLAVINFYLETANCITKFYDIKEGATPSKLPNQTNGYIYALDDLDGWPPGFNAEPGDVYILDVTKVHSVIPLEGGEIKRKALCLASSSLDFNQVQELLNYDFIYR